eukprot:GHRQ01030261.1.p2 GENE.GHRQ01030261.1~~GHRQ01030261.1.p2  ORF type:complete len:133 (+),score=71.63 GHRQ01030261.1:173-571(+)
MHQRLQQQQQRLGVCRLLVLPSLLQLQQKVMTSKLQQQQQQPQRLADGLGPQQARHLLLQWHLANIEFANATRLKRLSMRHWDLDDEHEHQGSHVFLPGGNLRLLQGLALDLPIFYKAPARLLQYSSAGVRA